MPVPLSGVIPVLQTPFQPDGEIDVDALRAEIAWVADQGVSGVATGMVSELFRLDDSERARLAQVVAIAAREHGLVCVLSAGAESTRQTVRQALHAEQVGADAVMVNPPVTVRLDSEALQRHFCDILDHTTISVIVQDASGYIGSSVPLELQAALFDRYGERVHFKPEADPVGPRFSQLRDLTRGRARILEGSGGGALVDTYRRGAAGTMPGAEVCWAIQRFWDALGAADWATAYRISGVLNALLAVQTTIETYVAVEKRLLVRQGVLPAALAREPGAVVLDPETAAEVDRLFDRLQRAVAVDAVETDDER